MRAAKPVGRIIALSRLKKGILPQKSLEQKVDNLVDLITIRIKNKSVEEVANSLLEQVLELRFDFIEWLGDNDKDWAFYQKAINEQIAVNLYLSPYSNLAEAISKVLLACGKINAPIFEALPNSPSELIENITTNKPTYDSFKFFASHPSPKIRCLKNWVDASLQLEIGLILADLILTGQVKLSEKRIESELIEFLYRIVTRFGAYSIFTGFWTPEEDDTSNMTNRMRILNGVIELDNNIYHRISMKGLFNMLQN